MLIGHISDLHTLAPGNLLGGKLDTNDLALKAVNAMNSASEKPSFVVVTGDLTHHGKLEEMYAAKKILDELSMPYFVLPGAHDDIAYFWKAFGNLRYLDQCDDGVNYTVDAFGIQVVVVDTTSGKGKAPYFGGSRLNWLINVLEKKSTTDSPVVLAMHHPPFQCQIPVATYLNDADVKWANSLRDSVSRSTKVKLVLCGHVHRSIQTSWAGSLLSVAPATCVQARPNFGDFQSMRLSDKRTASLVLEPPGYQFHWWNGKEFATYTMFSNDFMEI